MEKPDINEKMAPPPATSVYPQLYTKGTRVWIKHPVDVWQCCEIKEDFDKNSGQLILLPPSTAITEPQTLSQSMKTHQQQQQQENDADDPLKDRIIPIKDLEKDLPPLRNPDILIGSNDLTSLSYLHEPSVLYNLRVRFLQHQQIYTWCGIVLVAINPFTDLEIYGDETIQMYHSNLANLSQMDPHIYAVAEDAFTKLECNNINQSVIVSGESGAGKTVSAKFAMRYFASIAGSDSNIEARVLASNPIMEAIGNAKTVRNDNSSRFGKYIQILFDRRNRHIMGGNMRTYLLEKSRVTYQSEGERNFHIFYQLCNHARTSGLDHLGLSDEDKEFAYLGSNEKTQYDDMRKFLEALDTLGFGEKQKNILFQVIASILHGGNIQFDRGQDEESCSLQDENSLQSLQIFCKLLDLNESLTLKWLTSRLLKTGTREIITTPLNAQTAQYGLEALLKFIYEKMFLWIVSLINQSLGPIAPPAGDQYQFIGVLDIYGFEHFEKNSFEQFCINYANEVLQQQFNWHVFKLEQDEYVREGIDWQFITFTDNQPVIDLIESKPIGILCLLDEECRMPQGNDRTWCTKLYKQIPTGQVFRKPKFNFQSSFIIEHFADVVTYSVDGFLEKNRDTIWEEQIDLLKRSSVAKCLFLDDDQTIDSTATTSQQKKGAGGKIKVGVTNIGSSDQRQKKKAKATIGFQFRESLDALMQTLNSTEPHYVRCIKPNDNKAGFEFNNIRAIQQLRACGVLETIRISSNGYPSRWSYQDFANRYRVLRIGYQKQKQKPQQQSTDQKVVPKPTPRKLVRAGSSFAMEIRTICEDIVRIVYEEKIYSHLKMDQSESTNEQQQRKLYQFGKTKIFFRPGQVALLERIRSQKLRECAILIQKIVRCWLQRKRYQKIRQAALALQKYGRGWLARKNYQHMRRTRAAIIIQKRWRGYWQKKRYQKLRHSVLGLQTKSRGYLARKRYLYMKQNCAATTIQRYWRGYVQRKRYQQTRKKIILVQSCIRRHFAKKEYRRLRIEARSVEHVTNLNKGLEKKIISLQQRIDDLVEENRLLKLTEAKYGQLKHEMEQLDNEVSELKTRQREDLILSQRYQSELEKLKTFNHELEQKVQKLEQIKSDLEQKIRETLDNKKQMAMDNEKVQEAIKRKEQELREEFDQQRKILIAEKEKEQTSKQQLLLQYMDLKEQLEPTKSHSPDMERRERHLADNEAAIASLPSDRDFDSNLDRISYMMQCTELEQELKKLQGENQKLRDQIAKNVDDKEPSAAASLLTEQFQELQDELARYKKERADLKRVILIEDHINTMLDNGPDASQTKQKYQDDLVNAYKVLFSKMDEQIANKDKIIQKLKNENLFLKCSTNKSQSLNNPGYIGQSIDYHHGDMLNSMDHSNRMCFHGMFKFRAQDIELITRYLFYEFDPTQINTRNQQCDSHTIAFIAYMCIRYLDDINNEKLAQAFMIDLFTWLKKKAKTASDRTKSMEILVHLLACAFKVSILIKYYSEYEVDPTTATVTTGKKSPSTLNREKSPLKTLNTNDAQQNADSGFDDNSKAKLNGKNQTEDSEEPDEAIEADVDMDLDMIQSLKNFDLTEFIKLLKEMMIWIYLKMVKIFEEKISRLIVAAVLEHQELSGMSMRQKKEENQNNSDSESGPPSPTERELDTLFKELSNIQALFRLHRLDEHFVFQFFKQIYHFIGTTALNTLILRKDLCTNDRAIEIIYNVSLFEQFLRENNIMNWDEVKSCLDPILQATKLLISTKTEKQIPAIVLTTQSLTVSQVMKIINMYTPSDEEQISPNFIKNLHTELQKQRIKTPQDKAQNKAFLMDTSLRFPLYIPFIDHVHMNSSSTIGTNTDNISALQATGLNCNFRYIEIPMSLHKLERHLEKI